LLFFYNLIAHVNKQLIPNKNVIVDTNFLYKPACAQLTSSHTTYVLIYAPLAVLLERDSKRNHNTNRTKIQAINACEWVKKSYDNLFSSEKSITYDCIIDTNVKTLEEAVTEIISLPQIASHLSYFH